MSIATIDERDLTDQEQRPFTTGGTPAPDVQYRALCTSAVVAFTLGVLSILAFADFWMGVIPLLAIILGLTALHKIARRPDEYTGRRFALIGLTLAVVFWSSGAAWLSYVYINEVPEGFRRISYDALQPADNDPNGDIPASAKALNGQQVFIKGYIYPPPGAPAFVTTFLLVRDNGDCCFGGNPKISDRILVRLRPDVKLEFTKHIHAVAGTLRVNPGNAVDAAGGVWYQLEGDYAK